MTEADTGRSNPDTKAFDEVLKRQKKIINPLHVNNSVLYLFGIDEVGDIKDPYFQKYVNGDNSGTNEIEISGVPYRVEVFRGVGKDGVVPSIIIPRIDTQNLWGKQIPNVLEVASVGLHAEDGALPVSMEVTQDLEIPHERGQRANYSFFVNIDGLKHSIQRGKTGFYSETDAIEYLLNDSQRERLTKLFDPNYGFAEAPSPIDIE